MTAEPPVPETPRDADADRPAPVPYPVESPGRGPLHWGLAVLMMGVGAMLLLLAVLLLGLMRRGEAFLDGAGALFSQPQPTPVVQTRAVILRELRGASELTTAISELETVVDESQERTLGGLTIGRTDLLYVAHGQVRAGVDLAELSEGDVDVSGDVVTVRLPPPRVLDAKIDVDKSYTYDLRRSLLGPVDPDMQSRAERYALEKVRRAACEGGVLEAANERAALAVTALLGAAGFDDVAVETAVPPPGECRPAVDAGDAP